MTSMKQIKYNKIITKEEGKKKIFMVRWKKRKENDEGIIKSDGRT